MAIIGSLIKQPREIPAVDIDYALVIGTRTADSVTPTIEPPAGMTLASSQVDGSVLQLFLNGGTDGQVYRWTVLTDIVISGRTLRVEDEFHVLVEEVSVDTTDLAVVMASPAGGSAARITRGVGDDRSYVVDCAPLLRKHEMLTGITSITPDAGLTAGAGTLLRGRFLEVPLSGGTVSVGAPYTDYGLKASLTSTRGAVQMSLTVRVYA